MTAFTPEQKKHIHNSVQELNTCPLNERVNIINNLSLILGCSEKSTRRHLLLEGGWQPARKLRADKGESVVSKDFALKNASIILKATRDNGKSLMSFKQSLDILEGNGIAPFDEKTGEVKSVSKSTLARKMRDYGLHPAQLKRGKPAMSMKSLHPNHTWQIDASVCVMVYLPKNKVEVLDEKIFYKNKPQNLEKISKKRLVRYVITDHYSGFVYVRYELGDEDAIGVINTLIGAMVNKGNTDVIQGVPYQLLLDKGAGNMSNMVKSFCENLSIKMLPHATGNARAKGQVECANNLVEKGFESRLKFLEINNLEELQTHADKWRKHFNARSIHSRTHKPRSIVWSTIQKENLRTVEKDVLQEIAVWKNETRIINGKFQISVATKKYGALDYDLRDLSYYGFSVKDEVSVCINPFSAPNITVTKIMPNGEKVSMEIAPIMVDEAGFRVDSPVIGVEHKALAKTQTEYHLESIEKLAYNVDNMEDVELAKKQKTKPFSELDFMADVKKERSFLVTNGENIFENKNTMSDKMITRIAAAKIIKESTENLWNINPKISMDWLKNKFESHIPESKIPSLIEEFKTAFGNPKFAFNLSKNIDVDSEQNQEQLWNIA